MNPNETFRYQRNAAMGEEVRATFPQPQVKNGFDYDNQAWVINGLYVDCGHDHNKPCPGGNCFGRTHAGEPVIGEVR